MRQVHFSSDPGQETVRIECQCGAGNTILSLSNDPVLDVDTRACSCGKQYEFRRNSGGLSVYEVTLR